MPVWVERPCHVVNVCFFVRNIGEVRDSQKGITVVEHTRHTFGFVHWCAHHVYKATGVAESSVITLRSRGTGDPVRNTC